MNKHFDLVNKSFLALYFVSIATSMAGMELFSSLCVLSSLSLIIHKAIKGIDLKVKTGLDPYLWGLWFIATLGALFLSTVPREKVLYIISSFRWILTFYAVKILIQEYFSFFKKFLKWFYVLLLIISLYTVFQSFNGIDVFRGVPADWNTENLIRTHGFYSSIMSFSYVFGMIFCYVFAFFLFAKKWATRLALATLILPMGYALYSTYTRGAWIAIIASILLISLYKSLKITALLFTTLIFVGAVTFNISPQFKERVTSSSKHSAQSNSERLGLWKANWAIAKDNIWTGVGYRQNYRQVPEYYKKLNIKSNFVSHAHNNFLEILTGFGIFGFFLYLAIIFKVFKTAHVYFKKSDKNNFAKSLIVGTIGAQTCFHIGGLTEATLLDAETTHAFATSLGLFFSLKSVAKDTLF